MQDREFSGSAPLPEERPGLLAWGTWLNMALLLTLVIPLLFLKFRPPVRQEQAEQEKVRTLEARRDDLQKQKDYLQMKNDLIRHDPDYLEAMARDRMGGMQKDGEVILRFEK